MKINLLPSEVYNRISAGEVVENPASVVKELVENALDAGATALGIRIEDGGIKSIEVSDNGSGIERAEIHKTVLPHATSKIEIASDLDTVSTLGFRGEALASIAAVSEVEILTKSIDEECGSRFTVKNGKSTLEDAAVVFGTTVKVNNLFYNTPARFKFLSSKSSEESKITRLVFMFILANPDVAPVLANNRNLAATPFAMRWGYRLGNGKLLFNARSETADAKALFRDGMRHRRCLVPAAHYFEWEKRGKDRIKYAIRPGGAAVMYMAGIYRLENGAPVFTILTREPAAAISFIHDRMPVILPKEAAGDWLNIRYDAGDVLAGAVQDVECWLA